MSLIFDNSKGYILDLCLETKTNESITSTTAPFFVSLPMTTVQ